MRRIAAAGGSERRLEEGVSGQLAETSEPGVEHGPAAGGLLGLQRTYGNRWVQSLVAGARQQREPAAGVEGGPAIQCLSLGPASDRYEREADEAAERAVGDVAPGPPPPREEVLADRRIQRLHGSAGGAVHPVVDRAIGDVRGRGQRLPGPVRGPLESSLGADFGNVRVHTDARADALSRALSARAFTTGSDIFFRHGEYHPSTTAGRRTLAHELTHVVQQTGPRPTTGPTPPTPAAPIQRIFTDESGKKILEDELATRELALIDTYGRGDWQNDFWLVAGLDEPEPLHKWIAKTFQPQGLEPANDRPRLKRLKRNLSESGNGDDPFVPFDPVDPVTSTAPLSSATDPFKRPMRVHPSSLPIVSTTPLGDATDLLKWPLSIDLSASDMSIDTTSDAGPLTIATSPQASAANANEVRDLEKMKAYLTELRVQEASKPAKKLTPRRGALGAVVLNLNHLSDNPEGVGGSVDYSEMQSRVSGSLPGLVKILRTLERRLKAKIQELWSATKVKTLRSSLSQLATDIDMLLEEGLVDAVVQSLGELAKPDVTAEDIVAQAQRFSELRRLARTANRIGRLRTIFSDVGTKTPKWRQALQGVSTASGLTEGSMIWAPADRILEVFSLASDVKDLKIHILTKLLTGDIFQNEALDLALMNEMNLGIEALQTAVTSTGGKVGLSRGPKMMANAEGDEKKEEGSTQYEYYSATFRTESLEPLETFYVNTDGDFIAQGGRAEYTIGWNKAEEVYRGIVVHRFRDATGQETWSGIIHTTPYGHDLQRKEVWKQITKPLKSLSDLAKHFRIPLLVGGDLYIQPEAVVADYQMTPDDTETIVMGKVLNIARNLWWYAYDKDQLHLLGIDPKGVNSQTDLNSKACQNTWLAFWNLLVDDGVVGAIVKEQTATDKPKSTRGRGTRGRGARGRGGRGTGGTVRRGRGVNTATVAARLAPLLAAKVQSEGLDPEKLFGWEMTMIGGDIQEIDFVRIDAGVTFKDVLESTCGLEIVPAGYATNIKPTAKRDDTRQLADLFMVNEFWGTAVSGFLIPALNEIWPTDDDALTGSSTYFKISDHLLVLALLSTAPMDVRLHGKFRVPREAWDEARQMNLGKLFAFQSRLMAIARQPSPPEVSSSEESEESDERIDLSVVIARAQRATQQAFAQLASLPGGPGMLEGGQALVLEAAELEERWWAAEEYGKQEEEIAASLNAFTSHLERLWTLRRELPPEDLIVFDAAEALVRKHLLLSKMADLLADPLLAPTVATEPLEKLFREVEKWQPFYGANFREATFPKTPKGSGTSAESTTTTTLTLPPPTNDQPGGSGVSRMDIDSGTVQPVLPRPAFNRYSFVGRILSGSEFSSVQHLEKVLGHAHEVVADDEDLWQGSLSGSELVLAVTQRLWAVIHEAGY